MSSGGGLEILLERVTNSSYMYGNPVEPYIASGWNYMTQNYSRFTIAMWFSVMLHEVRDKQQKPTDSRVNYYSTLCR